MRYLNFVLLCIICSNSPADTFLHLQSDIEHFYSIPDGLTYTNDDGVFEAKNIVWHPSMGLPSDNTIKIDFSMNNSTFEYVPDLRFFFSAPDAESLQLKTYTNFYMYPFHRTNSLHQAGFDLTSGHTGCSEIGGAFSILDISLVNNMLTSFAADFTFLCKPGDSQYQVQTGGGWDDETHTYTPPTYRDAELKGYIRINSDIPITPVPIPASIYLLTTGMFLLFMPKFNKSSKPTTKSVSA